MQYGLILVLLAVVAQAQGNYSLEGTVQDLRTGEILAGANVLLEEAGLETAADEQGRFRFAQVNQAVQVLSVSHVGYHLFKRRLDLGSDQQVKVELRPRLLPGQEVVVTAERARERQTPAAFSDLGRGQIERTYWAQDLPMLLTELPGVYSYSDAGHGLGYSYLKVRGFDQKRVGVMLNGVPLNDPEDHQVYWVDLPDLATSLEDAQVQRGVTNSLYGASAFGGSVNLLTSTLAQEQGIAAALGTGSYGTRRFSVAMNSGLVDHALSMHARFSKTVSDGYRERSGVDQWAYFLAVARYGERTTTQVNLYGGPERVLASWDAVSESVLKENRRANFTQDLDNFNQPQYQLIHEWDFSPRLRLSNTLFYVHGEGYYEGFREQRRLRDFGLAPIQTADPVLFGTDSLTYYQTTEVDGQQVLAHDVQGLFTLERTDLVRRKWVDKDQGGWLGRAEWEHGRGQLTAGSQVYDFNSKHRGWVMWAAALPGGRQPELSYYAYRGAQRAASLYLHELYDWGDRLKLMGELQTQYKRYRFRHQEAGNFIGEERNTYQVKHLFFNPRLGANYNLNERVNFFASLALARQEPADVDYYDAFAGPDDLGADPLFARADTVVRGGVVERVEWDEPLIDPEQVLDWELGMGYRAGAASFKTHLYWMDFRDEIIPYGQVDDDNVPVRGNADRTVHRGAELVLSCPAAPGVSFAGNLALSQNYYSEFTSPFWDEQGNVVLFDYSGNTIPLFPGRLANARLTGQRRGASLSLHVQHVGKQYLDNTEDQARAIDPFTVLNLSAAYRLEGLVGVRGLRFDFHLNNLLDEEYETSGYYFGERYLYAAAGRNYYLGMRVEM